MLKLTILCLLVGICFAQEGEKAVNIVSEINQQIMYELSASYFYQAYSQYFGRSDVALPGLAKWFEKASAEERGHANMLMEYLNKRGWQVGMRSIQYSNFCKEIWQEKEGEQTIVYSSKGVCICNFMAQTNDESKCDVTDRDNWKNALWGMEDALALERKVNKLLIELHSKADEIKDAHLAHILEHHFLDEQVEAIKEINDYITQIKRAGDDLGEYLFDKQLQ